MLWYTGFVVLLILLAILVRWDQDPDAPRGFVHFYYFRQDGLLGWNLWMNRVMPDHTLRMRSQMDGLCL
ncbi:MAG: hypothetical protein H3C47_14880 [Candidatus Cloacimonetes bacterium]|nr:hypothetical protein [Candidatus Cloacimonadota bacterium]